MTRSLVVPLLLLAACGPDPVELCEELADAFAATGERCGHDYEEYRQTLLDMTVDGSCAGVTEVRDAKELEDACIPWVEDLTCEQLDDPELTLRPACEDQLRI